MATCGTVRLTPGPQGPAGANGTDGTDGVNAYTSLNGNAPDFAMPAELGNGTATVLDSTWMAPGQIVYLQGAGHLQVVATPTSTTVTLKNLEDTPNGTYADNVAAGTPIADGSKLSPAGKQGPDGTDGVSGAPTDATYITRQAEAGLSAEFSLGTLTTGMLKHTVAAGVSTPATATDGTDFLSPTTGLAKSGNLAGLADAGISRTNLGVAIGTNVQAYDALLAAIAALVTAADQTIYSTGVDTVAMTSLTAFGRSLIDDATAAAARTTIGVNRTPQDIIILRDQKASTTEGGTFTSGAWQTRDLNTEVCDTGNHCSLAANQFTLADGTYHISASAPGHRVDHHQIRILDVVAGGVLTTGGVEAYGTNVDSDNAGDHSTVSLLQFRFTVTGGPKAYALQHRCSTTRATDGFGHANSFGGPEVYAQVLIEREAG